MKVFPKSPLVALLVSSGICIHETVPCSSGPAVREKCPGAVANDMAIVG